MGNYLSTLFRNNGTTPQSEPLLGAGQVPNSAGGYSFGVDDWTRLQRFLILGSEGGSYYASERKLTAENAGAVLNCIGADGPRVVREIISISASGRAPKNDPALFALALCASLGDEITRREALKALPQVARIGTHLFHFAAYVDSMRGWGRGLRLAVGNWYNGKPVKDLAYQAIKYQGRDGWSHRDMLRLAHPQPADELHRILFGWITQGWDWVGEEPHSDPELRQVWAFERLKRAEDEKTVISLIREYRLPRETVPTQWLNSPAVWEALLEDMPMTALIRNLATLTRIGLVTPNSETAHKVSRQLKDESRLRSAKVHPIAVLTALRTYASGRGVRGSNTWKPVNQVVEALDDAFYLAFGNVTPTGKRHLLALDVSGSMTMGSVAGVPGLSPRDASAAMALVTAATEEQTEMVCFSTTLQPLNIGRKNRLDQAIKRVSGLPFGGTDCAQPMLWALEKKVPVDLFVVYTDSETWAGQIHPVVALRKYREATGIPARLAVVGMVSNGFSIADPTDAGMLDVVGFDTATPQLLSSFARGEI